MRNKLFIKPSGFGGDLMSIDIHRGRDHGLPPYHTYFSECTGREVHDWDDLQGHFTHENIEVLKKAYETIFDVDLLVGCMLETHDYRLMGVVARCIARKQFVNLKFGDRYFYSFSNSPDPFTTSMSIAMCSFQ